MFKLLLSLVILTFTEAKLELTFIQNSQELDVQCKLPDVENTTIVNVISLDMSRTVGGKQVILASVTPFAEPVTNTPDEVVLTSSVSLDGSSGVMANLHWPRATPSLDGPYKCELNGLDDNNTPVTLTQNLVIALKNLEPTLLIKPSTVEVGLTQFLEVQCFIKDFSTTKISSVISIDLFRMRDGIEQLLATASAFSGVEAISGVVGAEVTGFIANNKQENYLKVTWPHPSFDHVGDYLCEITALNVSNLPVDLRRVISLVAIDPPRQLLINRIHNLEGMYQNATEEISQLHADIEQLKNNFTKDTADMVKAIENAKQILDRVTVECPSFPFYKSVCDFEHGKCGFETHSTSSYAWTLLSGPTGSDGTGPDADHTLNNTGGHYFYTEASSGADGDKTTIERSLPPNPDRQMCVDFWYNMYGQAIGQLNFYLQKNGDMGKPVWSRAGDQGQGWKHGFIAIPPSNASLSAVFEGVRSDSFEGDIAIDDVQIYDTPCQQ